MAIFWDSFATTNKYSGIGVYSSKLLDGLEKQGVKPSMEATNSLLSSKISHFLYLNYKSFDYKNDIFHGLANFNVPIANPNIKSVLTIHDIIPLIARGQVSKSSNLQLNYLLKLVLPRVKEIICVSSWTKNCLDEYFSNYNLHLKTTVIPNGFSKFEPLNKEESSKISVLFVSRFEEYKNFSLLKKIIESSNPDKVHFDIVTDITGMDFLKSVNSSNYSPYHQVDDSTLKSLYKKSSLLIHTSSYEGFCLPAMEAIKYARPVLYLKGSAIDQTVGQDGFGMDSITNIEMWNDKILELAGEAYYNEFISNVSSHIDSRPSWQNNAHMVKDIYSKLGG